MLTSNKHWLSISIRLNVQLYQNAVHSKNTYEIRQEVCTGFAAISNETATTTLWPLVIATVAVRTSVGHFLNGHNAVGAVVCTVFYAVFPYYTSRSAVESAVSALH